MVATTLGTVEDGIARLHDSCAEETVIAAAVGCELGTMLASMSK
jgi:ABC-type protease/lipase transport system fused ATPase/permease subunit